MSKTFHFKKFSIKQENAPMKVGTDGVLLGAWVKSEKPKKVLDIGTGTGLIALMMAQRFAESEIIAIEANEMACADASNNFQTSAYSDRISLICDDFLKVQFKEKYDVIVCNPPFFIKSLNSPFPGRNQAKHAAGFTPRALAEKTASLLSERGKLFVIYPPEGFSYFSEASPLYLSRKMDVRPTEQKLPHRTLGEFQKLPATPKTESLIIEKYGRHGYSEEYQSLTQDFYLNRVFNRT